MTHLPNNTQDVHLHLLFTSIITEERRIVHTGTKKLKGRNRVSIFLTTINSLAVLPITTSDFYIELDSTTEWARDLIYGAIRNLPFQVNLIENRLEYYLDWVSACESINSINPNQVMLLTLDDHVFVNKNIKEFERISKIQIEVGKSMPELNSMVLLSHFPETHALVPIASCINSLVKYKKDLLVPVVVPIGAILLSHKELSAWFQNDFTGKNKFVNPENPYGAHVFVKNGYYIVPRFELFRHLDAYSHIGLKGWPYQVMNPFITVSNNQKIEITKQPWEFTASCKKPRTKLSTTYLNDSKLIGDFLGFCASILKSNSIRVSFKSINLVNIEYGMSRKSILFTLIYLCLKSKVFRLALLRTFSEFPIRVLLRIFGKFLYDYLPSHPIKFYNLISSSSIGFFRFTRIVLLEVFKRKIARVFKRLSHFYKTKVKEKRMASW